jgi:HEAT repeat protein
MKTLLWCTFAFALLALSGLGQEGLADKEIKRYRRELQAGRDLDQRRETLRNIAFFDNRKATLLLIDLLRDTLKEVADLEAKRAENDEKIRKDLESQILQAKKNDGMINIAGVVKYQEYQRRLGDQITLEEQALRAFRDALASLKNRESLSALMKFKPGRKEQRLKQVILDVLGRIDDGEVTEHLLEQLSDKDEQVQIAAAEALSHHDPERVPPQAYAALLESEQWRARAVAIEALARVGGAAALEILSRHTTQETGRQLSDLCQRLEKMTRQKLGKSPQAWVRWWEDHKDSFEPRRVVLQGPLRRVDQGRFKYWGIEIDSLRVVFVMDISQTMAAALKDPEDLYPPPGESRLDLARREIKAAITALPSDASFNLIAYNDVVIPWEEKLIAATPTTKKKAFAWIDQLAAVSATNIFDALEMAFQLSSRKTKGKGYDRAADTILFLSDGGPTAGRTTDCDEILAQVTEWNRTRKITIHTIGIGSQINREFLRQLALHNGGEFRLKQ